MDMSGKAYAKRPTTDEAKERILKPSQGRIMEFRKGHTFSMPLFQRIIYCKGRKFLPLTPDGYWLRTVAKYSPGKDSGYEQ